MKFLKWLLVVLLVAMVSISGTLLVTNRDKVRDHFENKTSVSQEVSDSSTSVLQEVSDSSTSVSSDISSLLLLLIIPILVLSFYNTLRVPSSDSSDNSDNPVIVEPGNDTDLNLAYLNKFYNCTSSNFNNSVDIALIGCPKYGSASVPDCSRKSTVYGTYFVPLSELTRIVFHQIQ